MGTSHTGTNAKLFSVLPYRDLCIHIACYVLNYTENSLSKVKKNPILLLRLEIYVAMHAFLPVKNQIRFSLD